MRLDEVTIENFKAIKKATISLSAFNVIVGANGSGKSSVLQAMHWMFQSGRNPNIYPRKAESRDGVTLSERHATYMPSPDYKNAGYSGEYGNQKGSPQLDLAVKATASDNAKIEASMFIKSARNEGLSVHVPTGNQFVVSLRDESREFSAYIPGLAGIPLSEEKRTKLIVHRLAAAGDANTVLRNVLLMLKDIDVAGRSGLGLVSEYVSKVMGEFTLDVSFNDSVETTISAKFQTKEMKSDDAKKFKPLEMAGIGFLQVIQIFAYLVYFRHVILLVDEPDAHLHPTAQDLLVNVLADAAMELGTQVILSTHSPSVVRSLPAESRVIWMREGEVHPKGDTEGRSLMGWGLLDKKAILMTEDKDTGMLNNVLAQWPDLNRKIAVWPFHGSNNIPTPQVINGLVALTGKSIKVLIHRDRDFLMPDEVAELSKSYDDSGHVLWFTEKSDMEAYWTTSEIIAAHFAIDEGEAGQILSDALHVCREKSSDLEVRRKKRVDAVNKIKGVGQGRLPQYGDNQVQQEAERYGEQFSVLCKDLSSAVRMIAQNKRLPNYHSYGEVVPTSLSGQIAIGLKGELERICN